MKYAVVVLALVLGACASYDERVQSAHRAFYQGDPAEAVKRLRAELEEQPRDWLVLQLDIASALQADGRYAQAAKVLAQVDQRLEVLDYTTDSLADIARFTFAPDLGPYRASPPERVMLNTQNMLNFLAAGDLQSATVEARRLSILLNQSDVPEEELFANHFAWGLAGLVLEAAGDRGEAEDAFRAAGLTPLSLRKLAAGIASVPPSGVRPAIILVVAQLGQAPIRVPAVYQFFVAGRVHRLNVPTLVTRRTPFRSVQVSLDGVGQGKAPLLFDYGAHVRQRYDQEFPRLLAAAATQVIPRSITAEAVRTGIRHALSDADHDGKGGKGGGGKKAGFKVKRGSSGTVGAWDTLAQSALRGQLAGDPPESESAGSGYGGSQGKQQKDRQSDADQEAMANAVATLVANLVEYLLAELASTDTRSWSLLPDEFHGLRLNVPPGQHRVTLQLDGQQRRSVSYDVEVGSGQVALINLTSATLEGWNEPPTLDRRSMSGRPEGELALQALEDALRQGAAFSQ